LAEVKKQYADIIKYKTRAFALSVDSPKQSQAVVSEMMLPFDLLCDVDKKVIALYDLVNPFEHGGISRPAIFIINPGGKICFRSLDGTAHRADLAHVLNFLKAHYDNPDLANAEPVDKKWIIPSWKTTGQIVKNMVLRGNIADWKHYGMFPLNPIIIPLKKLKRKLDKKGKTTDQV
jgi:alkyl hydroperoxide reductase subunit AhpC